MTPETSQVDAVAKAIVATSGGYGWDQLNDTGKQRYRLIAAAAIESCGPPPPEGIRPTLPPRTKQQRARARRRLLRKTLGWAMLLTIITSVFAGEIMQSGWQVFFLTLGMLAAIVTGIVLIT